MSYVLQDGGCPKDWEGGDLGLGWGQGRGAGGGASRGGEFQLVGSRTR